MSDLNLSKERDLPQGWTELGLGQIRRSKSVSFNPKNEGDITFELYSVPSHETGRPEIIKALEIGSNKQFVEPDDVLISKINPRLNRSWVVGSFSNYQKIASTEWIVFSRSKIIKPQFLKYLLTDARIRDFLSHNASGVGGSLTRVKPGLFDHIYVGLPPYNEQKRIVAKIEELFSELDKGIENLKTAREQLKVYRQAILKHAFEGKLTANWREKNKDKLKTADELLERIKQERETAYQQQLADCKNSDSKGRKPHHPKPLPPLPAEVLAELPELPKGWVYVRAEEITGFITKGTTPRKELLFDKKGEIPFIKVYNLTKTGFLDFSVNPTFVNRDTHNGFLARSKVYPGDVLMNIVGPPLGKVSIVPSTYPEWNINQAIAIFRGKLVSNKFLAFYLAHESTVRLMMRKSKATAGQFNLTLEICRETLIPFCSQEEQKEIELLIEAQISEVDQLDQNIIAALQKSESLRQSILKRAFSGKLVAQDPKDEPASVLLERIKVEKNESPKRKKNVA